MIRILFLDAEDWRSYLRGQRKNRLGGRFFGRPCKELALFLNRWQLALTECSNQIWVLPVAAVFGLSLQELCVNTPSLRKPVTSGYHQWQFVVSSERLESRVSVALKAW